MINKQLNAHIAVISHKRAQNATKIMEVLGCEATFYVNIGEANDYYAANATHVVECGTEICLARNMAIRDARKHNLPSIQVSDDLRSLKRVRIQNGKHVVESTDFFTVAKTLLNELYKKQYFYGGVAVTSNRLNYTGLDFDYDKLVVCDLICMMPGKYEFDPTMQLKEDYDMTITQLIEVGGLVRCNQFLCDFPHRTNAGGGNSYRNEITEGTATRVLLEKWPGKIKAHPTRPGQIALDYKAIRADSKGSKQQSLF